LGHQETTDLIILIMDRTLLRYADISISHDVAKY